jgi:hypothetical protein
MSDGDFVRVLAEAGEPAPGPRPAGWQGEAVLAAMRQDMAALVAARAARWAVNAGRRREGREVYERTRLESGYGAAAELPPWLLDEPPPCRIW